MRFIVDNTHDIYTIYDLETVKPPRIFNVNFCVIKILYTQM